MFSADLIVAPVQSRRAFHAWSVAVPSTFLDTFVEEDSYWHAWDDGRSVSMTSIVLKERGRAVSAKRIVDQVGGAVTQDGEPVDGLPEGLIGRASFGPTPQPARASKSLTGVLATDGRALLVTITSDDYDWALATWLSIRSHPAALNVALAPSRQKGGAPKTNSKRGRPRR